MKTLKKIIFIVLALLPVLSLLFMALAVAFNDGFIVYDDFTDFSNSMTASRCTYSKHTGTLSIWDGASPTMLDKVLLSGYTYNVGGGNYEISSIYALPTMLGLPCTTAHLFAWHYMLYMFVVLMLYFVYELITFVPRKCSEIFQ